MKNRIHSRETRRLDRWRTQRGSTLVEFSITSVILVMLVFGVFQIGYTYFAVSSLNNAACYGARYGSVHPGADAAIKSNVLNHLTLANVSLNQIGVAYSNGSQTVDSPITVTVQYTVPSFMVLFGTRSITNISSTMRIEGPPS